MVVNKTKPVIIIGFAMIMLIFMVLIAVWVTTQQQQHRQLVQVDTLRQAAKSIANMRQAALRRSVLLHEMSLHDDYFDRNDLYEEFVEQAGYFIQARERLLSLSITDEEQQIWQELRPLVIENAQGQSFAAKLLLDGKFEQGHQLLTEQLIPVQQQIMSKLSGMFDHHTRLAMQAYEDAEQSQRSSYWIIGLLTALTVVVSISIIIFIVRTTSRIQRDLLKADEARVANRMKSEFLANMSHEIRTPLTSILGYSEMLMEGGCTEQEQRESLSAIHRNGTHLINVINEILDLSKVEAGKLAVERLPVNLFEVTADVRDVCLANIRHKDLQCGINFRYPLPELITTDPVRLKQILLNLVNNAIKFTEQGHIYLNIWCDRYARKLYFEVEDSGIGIGQDKVEQIFDAFVQAERNTTRQFGGTGLGLTLSRQLAQMLGGDISVKSLPGYGSTFTLCIDTGVLNDVKFVHDQQCEIPDNVHYVTERPELAGRVLLADDVTDNQRLISMMMTNVGVQVEIANNGVEVLEKVQVGQYDLILMDMQMPHMDGVEATRLLRQRHCQIPIVMLTANAYARDRQRCFEAGANGFLTKPLKSAELYQVLSQYLRGGGRAITSTLQEEIADMPDIIDILAKFVHYLPRQIAELQHLYEQQDWDRLNSKIHDLKGASGNFGFEEIYQQVKTMENHLHQQSFEQFGQQLKELNRMCSRISLDQGQASA